MIVLDASAAVSVILNLGTSAPGIRRRLDEVDGEFHVPHLFEVEVFSTLRRHNLRGLLSEERSRVALDRLLSMRLVRYPHTSFIERIWELKDNVTAYDASYIALAETLDAPLITTDGPLARSSGHRASIELFE